MLEEIVIGVHEDLVQEANGTIYFKPPKKFKDEFDIKSANPVFAMLTEDGKYTKLSYFFLNKNLVKRGKQNE